MTCVRRYHEGPKLFRTYKRFFSAFATYNPRPETKKKRLNTF